MHLHSHTASFQNDDRHFREFVPRLRFALNARATDGTPFTQGLLQRLAGITDESSNAIGPAHSELIS